MNPFHFTSSDQNLRPPPRLGATDVVTLRPARPGS